LRRQVDEMIAAHEHPEPFAIEERLLAVGAESGDEPVRPAGERVGPYRLVRLLGRGGMGEVYLAERADGEYHGQVAVKFLAGAGFRGYGESERRLRRERQILASLRHPGIASLYDGGVTEDGQPYLVMEYVDGRPISELCEERRLTIPERLDLFAKVCDAVQYAHARLVVHRDLKPSNLLVTADGTSKLLDFGIAKLLDTEDTDAPTRVFTPRRAAPEQIRGEPVSTATDVYALGVLLFELLTGHLPPERGDALRLRGGLRGDLEGILAKALAERPEDRYAAAGFLAEDIRRYLAGEPVQARRQTWIYRGRKFVRRHAVPVAALALATVTLIAAALYAAGQARRAARERDLALAAQDSLVDLLGMIEPEAGRGASRGDRVAVADLLARAERRALTLEEREVAARLLYVLGRIQRQRTDYRSAERLLSAARERHPGFSGDGLPSDIDFELGLTLRELGKRERARQLLTGVLESRRARYGDRHSDVFSVTLELAQMDPPAAALPRLERLLALERAAFPEDPILQAATLNALGTACFHTGDVRAARRHFEAAAALLAQAKDAPEPFTLAVLGNLAVTLDDPRRQEEIQRRRIAAAAAVHGGGSTVEAAAWTNLGVALALQGRHAESEPVFRRGYELFVARLGTRHPETASALRNVGRAQQLQRRYPQALATLRSAQAMFAGAGHGERGEAGIRYQAARVAWLVERSPEALAELRSTTRTLVDNVAGPRDPYPADAMVALGVSLLEAARPQEAAAVLAEALDRRRAAGGKKEMEARCALLLAREACGAKPDPRELRACARTLPAWGLADPELVARFAPWRE
jgi:tetratricopeptide (TPR) repeat protein/predicted Ser/Thr protein kinase